MAQNCQEFVLSKCSSTKYVSGMHQVLIPYATARTPDNTVCLKLINACCVIVTSDLFPGPWQLFHTAIVSVFPIPSLSTSMVCKENKELALGKLEWLIPGIGFKIFINLAIGNCSIFQKETCPFLDQIWK